MGTFSNTWGSGGGQGVLLNQIPFKSDLSFYSKSRIGLSLIDEIAGNNASILPCAIVSSGAGYSGLNVNSGIKAYSNTVWVLRGRNTLNTQIGVYRGGGNCGEQWFNADF